MELMTKLLQTTAICFILEEFGLFYSWLRKIFLPAVPAVFPRYLPWFGGRKLLFITANRITYLRTVMSLPVIILISAGQTMAAFYTFVIAGILDFVDGLVATGHRKKGYDDDKHLGAFLDAFCDKLFWGIIVIFLHTSLASGYFYHELVPTIKFALPFIFLFLLIIEGQLAITRVQDFIFNKRSAKGNKERNLQATHAGKFKFALELFGVGGLILPYKWAGCVGIICLVAAIPLAYLSLKQKLEARYPTS